MKHLTSVVILCSITLMINTSCNEKGGLSIPFILETIFLGNQAIDLTQTNNENFTVSPVFDLLFSDEVSTATVEAGIQLLDQSSAIVKLSLSYFNDNRTVRVTPERTLAPGSSYQLKITEQLKSTSGSTFSEAINFNFTTKQSALELRSLEIGGLEANPFGFLKNLPLSPSLRISFSGSLNPDQFERQLSVEGQKRPAYQISYEEDHSTVLINFLAPLEHLAKYELKLKAGNYGRNNTPGPAINQVFYTQVRTDNVFPIISDEALLTKVQEQTFKYFWEFGHPVSGLARERNTSGNLVTIGGSGFGIMAMIVAVERGFITREEALERWERIINFLAKADRFHGVWPHWMNGETGVTIPFSARDNGGDLVETAFMAQGLLTLRQYLQANKPEEQQLIEKINLLWSEIEWSWYTKGNEKQLYWHWSPDLDFAINLPIRGHNETQIVYILAAASTTYPIDKASYDQGYARSGNMVNNQEYYGLQLPLGPNLGGPLFFSHYSYLGLDPRNLKDQYANYWDQNVRHSKINQAYCTENPKGYVGYSAECWGLTASDGNEGYSAHSPANDRGIITPTAAISSIPYTPEESMAAIRYFYYQLGDRLWGQYGFYDAFNPTEEWVASSYLAIDQGPIICMIENHRTQLLWNLFMTAPEVQNALRNLSFTF